MAGMAGKGDREGGGVLSCNGAGAKCPSFLNRNGGQVQLYAKATQGERHRQKEKYRGRDDEFN